jgi:hypothetical protein
MIFDIRTHTGTGSIVRWYSFPAHSERGCGVSGFTHMSKLVNKKEYDASIIHTIYALQMYQRSMARMDA